MRSASTWRNQLINGFELVKSSGHHPSLMMQAKVVHRSLGPDSEPSEGGPYASDLRLRLAGQPSPHSKSALSSTEAVGESLRHSPDVTLGEVNRQVRASCRCARVLLEQPTHDWRPFWRRRGPPEAGQVAGSS